MSLRDTGPRLLLAGAIVLVLFVVAFFVARSGSADAGLPEVRERPVSGAGSVKHTPLRSIGAVPALPRAPRPRPRPRPRPTPSRPSTPPPAVVTPPPPPPIAPPPPPPPPSGGCLGEIC